MDEIIPALAALLRGAPHDKGFDRIEKDTPSGVIYLTHGGREFKITVQPND